MDLMEYSGRAGIVTGAGSGIGAASARRLALAGAKVAVGDLDIIAAEKVAREIRDAGGDAEPLVVDVADQASIDAFVSAAVETLGPLTFAHVNASTMVPGGDLLEMSVEQWDFTFAVNCRISFRSYRIASR